MVDSVWGAGSPGPLDRKKYEQQYKHSIDLFERALRQYQKAESPFQQAEFKNVMDTAMNVMNETAAELARKELQKHNEKISQDYTAFQQSPDSLAALEKLGNDLAKAKRTV